MTLCARLLRAVTPVLALTGCSGLFPGEELVDLADARIGFATDDLGVGLGVHRGDFDGDGIDDVIVAGMDKAYLLNGPLGGDVPIINATPRVEHGADAIVVGDFLGTGRDAIVGEVDSTTLRVLDYNDGAGQFEDGGAVLLEDLGTADVTAGDLTGDGISDLLVSSERDPWQQEAQVRFFAGPAGGAMRAPDAILTPEEEADEFGADALDVAPDLDGDGIDDLLILPWRAGAFHSWYVVPGPPVDLDLADARYSWYRQGRVEEWRGIGDIDGDGYGDTLSRDWVEVNINLGPLDLAEDPFAGDVTVHFESLVDHAEVVGDVNGDGFVDLALSNLEEHDWTPPSLACLVFGPLSGTIYTEDDGHYLFDSTSLDGVGADYASGDWNNDGAADLAVGVPGLPTNPQGPGVVYLLFDF